MRVLGIVPARGGSKGVPGKNIKEIAGQPLLAYTAQAIQASSRLTRTVLSTEDPAIAKVGSEWGLDAPFLRPAELAADDTPTLPVLQHAVRWFEAQGQSFDAVCLLQPTTPLRTGADIDACIDLLAESGADSVLSVLPLPAKYNPHWVFFVDDEGGLRLSTGEDTPIPRRQDLPPAYHRDGAIYVTCRDILMEENSLLGRRIVPYHMDPARTVNIDLPGDLRRAEELLAARDAASTDSPMATE